METVFEIIICYRSVTLFTIKPKNNFLFPIGHYPPPFTDRR